MRSDIELMKAVKSSDIDTLIKILGLEIFGQRFSYKIDQELIDKFKTVGLSTDDLKNIKSSMKDKVSKLSNLDIIELANFEVGDQEEPIEAATSVISSIEKESFAQRTAMSLEYVDDERKLILLYEIYELQLSPDQLISLVESPCEPVVLPSFVTVNGKGSSRADLRLIGTLDPEMSCINTSFQYKGIQVCDPEGYVLNCCLFYVEMKRLLLYYMLLKREKAERDKFNRLHNNAIYHPGDEIP
jgi:hypothetical protein